MCSLQAIFQISPRQQLPKAVGEGFVPFSSPAWHVLMKDSLPRQFLQRYLQFLPDSFANNSPPGGLFQQIIPSLVACRPSPVGLPDPSLALVSPRVEDIFQYLGILRKICYFLPQRSNVSLFPQQSWFLQQLEENACLMCIRLVVVPHGVHIIP